MVRPVGILSASAALFLMAFAAAFSRGASSLLAGMLVSAASITLGVWIGVVVTQPPGLLTDDDHEDMEGEEH